MELITVSRRQGLAFSVRLRGHEILTDMSPAEGGRDEGCNPVEMLAGTLGPCLAIMSQRFCDARGYRDGDVAVSLTAELADDPKRVMAFTVDVQLPRDVPAADREELSRMVGSFPIPATLREVPRLDVEFT